VTSVQRSTDRILATHVGSLPRPADLFALLERRERGEPVDERALEVRIDDAVHQVVRAQREHGLDIVNDGELGKTSFLTYVNSRLGGFEPIAGSQKSPWAGSREERSFPEYYASAGRTGAASAVHMRCTGPITYPE